MTLTTACSGCLDIFSEIQGTPLDVKLPLLNHLCRWVVRRSIPQGTSIFLPRLFKPLAKLLFKKVIAIYAHTSLV